MSSQEEESSPPHVSAPEQAKRKKKQRACDYCRRKKIRCDGAEMPDRRCSRCISQEIECTYEPINTRPPSKSYVQVLEKRLQNMEKLFGQLHPNVEIPKDFDGTLESTHWRVALPPPAEASTMASASSPLPSASVAVISPPPVNPPSPVDEDELDPSEDEREARLNILENLKRLTIPKSPDRMRYHGKSSNLMFLQTVIKQKYPDADLPRRTSPSSMSKFVDTRSADSPFLKATQNKMEGPPPDRNFPPDDLMTKLIDGYFDNLNIYMPLLHKPSFQRKIRDGVHLREPAFGAVVLLVCAIGSRWAEDPRAQADDGTSSGWCWFTQVDTVRWSLFERPTVEDVQACALIATFLTLSTRPQGSWTVMGLGLRMAQDVGAHRKKIYNARPSLQDELWRRAVWVLIYLDRVASFGLGRPSGLHDEDFDLDPMTEVDDEYWENEDPELAFKQPEGKPSKITFMNCLIRLQKILAYASRTIYSINKSKQTFGFVGPEWEQRTVAELDSALNKWIDTVPEHLKWDPNREDETFLNQSCTLYANYYWLQICIHRPFIQPSKANRLPFPSLTICTNAARSAMHVMETQFQKNGKSLLLNRLPLFTAGLVLLFNLWGGKRTGLSSEVAMADVHKCMYMLKRLEQHTYSSRRLWDVLSGLISIGELPQPGGSDFTFIGKPTLGNLVTAAIARGGDRENCGIVHADASKSAPQPTDDDLRKGGLSPFYYSNLPTTTASQSLAASSSSTSSRMPATTHNPANGNPNGNGNLNFPTDFSFELPVYTADLGRIPFHHGFSSHYDARYAAPQQQQPLFPSQTQQQQQQTFYPNALQPDGHGLNSASIPLSLSNGGLGGEDMNGDAFGPFTSEMSLADYGQLLAAMSVATAATPGPTTASQEQPAAGARMTAADADVSMMFEDHMVEMWSSAPTSLAWTDWGEYLNTMGGMDIPIDPPPQGM